jgi:NADH-quinone oxidoreductase subunit M
LIKKVFLGPFNTKWESLKDMNARELLACTPLLILMVVIGIFPSLVLDPINATLMHLVDLVKLP